MKSTVKFALTGDPHFEIIHNAEERLDQFLKKAREENVDFIIHTGDFSYPTDTYTCYCPIEKMPINLKNSYGKPRSAEVLGLLDKFNSFEKPSYHCMGNHEFDFAAVEDIVKIYGMDNNYYSFRMNNWHFIILDGNYLKTDDGRYEHYDHGHHLGANLPWIPTEQLEWLRGELMQGDEPVVIISHQPVYKHWGGVKNYAQVAEVIEEAKARGKDVRLCINGHIHRDELADCNGVLYYGANSMSDTWVDEEYQAIRFSAEIEEKYPNVRYTMPYDRAIFSIVTLDSEGISVEGIEGKYIEPGPDKLGYKGKDTSVASSWSRRWIR